MKKLYTLAFILIGAVAFAQMPVDTNITEGKQPTLKRGLYVELSYGYNTRSFMSDVMIQSDKAGVFAPKAYLSGNMVTGSLSYSFSQRISAFASFSQLFPNKHEYNDSYVKGYVQAKAWYTSAGIQAFPIMGCKLNPFIKLAFNAGGSGIRYSNTGIVTNVTYASSIRGGYTLGGSASVGAEYPVFKKAFVTAEVCFTNVVYKPKEVHNENNNTTKPYSNDLSDGVDPIYGYVYVSQNQLQEYINMNFISFRAGFKYYLFMR